jgi:DNA polymerase I
VTDLEARLRASGSTEAWVVDTEFTPRIGNPSLPLVLCALDILSSRRIELWLDPPPPCPFRMARDVLFIMFAADADVEPFITLGWPAPLRIIDPRVEWMRVENGAARYWDQARKQKKVFSLIDAKRAFHLSGIDEAEKRRWQERAAEGPPFTEAEKQGLIRYCHSDVDLTVAFLRALWEPAELGDERTFAQARIRGRSMAAFARSSLAGLPIDYATHDLIRDQAAAVRAGLVKDNRVRLPMFRPDGSLSHKRLNGWANNLGLLPMWPRTAGGNLLATKEEILGELAGAVPEVFEFLSFKQLLRQLQKLDLPIGDDGYARTSLFPLSTMTSRNAPSGRAFILAQSRALRPLIQPHPGRAIAVLDYSAQELRYAAFQSGDTDLRATTEAGDPYFGLAETARLTVEGDTPETNPDARETGKVISLAMLYGAGAGLLVSKGLDEQLAHAVLTAQRRKYARFYRWSDALAQAAHQGQRLTTRLGWQLRFRPGSDIPAPDRTGRNFPMQAGGAEIMRLVMIRATERGFRVTPLHDGFTIEEPDSAIERRTREFEALMLQAALDIVGAVIPVKIQIVRHPDRYPVKPGEQALFDRIVHLARAAEHGGTEWADAQISLKLTRK